MQKFLALSLIVLFSAISFNCGGELEDEIMGTWQGLSWEVEGKQKTNPQEVSFTFNSDKTYEARYGKISEKGTFRVFGRNLYTTAEDKLEKLVKFDFDENLNLIFSMNRMGTAERIIFEKIK